MLYNSCAAILVSHRADWYLRICLHDIFLQEHYLNKVLDNSEWKLPILFQYGNKNIAKSCRCYKIACKRSTNESH